ncbi:MAG: Radical domain protein [Acidimicrobiales bacterium]|jgi:radical SAM protein with 4Fe4S-binding SPASM domain|nr:Radical domain protein [Acidimicrobiales bacterium]
MAPLSILEEVGVIARSHRIPYHVLLELTYGCNLRCVMCYNPTHEAVGELSLEEYVGLFDELARLGTVQLTLTGGEVLARRDFWDIARAARDRHFALRIFTNGTRVTPEIAQRFADLAPLSVEVSLYGATAATHDAVTARGGSFVSTLEGIRNLRAAGVRVVTKTLLTQLNKHEVDDTLALVDALDVRFKGFDPVVFETHAGDDGPLALRVAADEVARLVPWHLHVTEDLACGDDEPMCGAAHDFVSITPHGEVYPCLSMRIPMGNIRDRSFEEIWTAPHHEVDRVRSATWGQLSTCGGCDARGVCQRCPGLAHHEDGDVLGPSSTHCELSFARLDDMTGDPHV